MNAVFFDYGNKYRHVKNENSKHVTYMDVESLLLFQAQQTHKTKKQWFLPKIVRPLLESDDITVVGQTQEIGNHKIIGVALAPPQKTWNNFIYLTGITRQGDTPQKKKCSSKDAS